MTGAENGLPDWLQFLWMPVVGAFGWLLRVLWLKVPTDEDIDAKIRDFHELVTERQHLENQQKLDKLDARQVRIEEDIKTLLGRRSRGTYP